MRTAMTLPAASSAPATCRRDHHNQTGKSQPWDTSLHPIGPLPLGMAPYACSSATGLACWINLPLGLRLVAAVAEPMYAKRFHADASRARSSPDSVVLGLPYAEATESSAHSKRWAHPGAHRPLC